MLKYFAFTLCLIILFCQCAKHTKISKNPNIIYVLADDMGYGDISAFNENSKIKTQNLDQIAADGIKFTDAHTSSSVCTPTRYGILTGRYNWRSTLKSGVLWGKSPALIPKERTTVAKMLQGAGYYTAFLGKWHLGWKWSMDSLANIDFSKKVADNPNDLGFDYAYGHSASLDIPPYVYVENGKPTAIPTDSTVNKSKYGWWRNGLTAPDFIHEDVTPNLFRKSINLIQERSKTNDPFFLYLALPSPHTPILPTEEWQGKSSLNPYGDFIMMMDDYMGQLEKSIKEAGIEENTILIFTSDNGCSPEADFQELKAKGHDPNYGFRGHKADIYEGGHRVPFIMKWPNRIKAGSSTDEIICSTDLMATCAEIIGYDLKADEGEDSYSLIPLFENLERTKPIREATVHHSIDGEFAIRRGDWKLIMCPGSGGWSYPTKKDLLQIDSIPAYQLFDLSIDPGEKTNLIEHQPEIEKDLKSLLIKYIIDGRSTSGPAQKNDPIDIEWKQISFVNEQMKM